MDVIRICTVVGRKKSSLLKDSKSLSPQAANDNLYE